MPIEVTVCEPYDRFGYRAEQGPFPYEAVYDFSSSDGGTLLEADVTMRLRGPARVFEPLVGRLGRRAYAQNLERMRVLLES